MRDLSGKKEQISGVRMRVRRRGLLKEKAAFPVRGRDGIWTTSGRGLLRNDGCFLEKGGGS